MSNTAAGARRGVNDGDVRGFLHVCCIGAYREVTWQIIHALLESRLYERCVTIDLAVLGAEDDQRVVQEMIEPFERFRIVYRSADLTEYEFPALGLVQDACQTWDGPVFYLHTKGVSYSPHNQYAHYWRRLMLDEVVINHDRCLAALRSCDIAGTNWSEAGLFSGNFWWARSSHIRKLPDIRELKRAPRNVTEGVRVDGPPALRRGVGPVWNQRLQCEYWLHMVPARTAQLGQSRGNLYRELCWTTSVGDLVDELLAVSTGRRYAELRVGGPSPHFASVRTDQKTAVSLRPQGEDPQADFTADFFVSEPPDGGYDVILLDIRAHPQHVAELLERCLPRLSGDGAVVMRFTNPPSAWHQRGSNAVEGAEWTGQVWRTVVDFRQRHPECEVFTVDTDWGCTVIRPGRRARGSPGVLSINELRWTDLVHRRRELLNTVDVAWFRRNLHATPYLAGTAEPTTAAEVANLLIAVEGLDSCLQIGGDEETLREVIAPIRQRIAAGEEAALENYDVVLVDDVGGLERAVRAVADGGWIVIGSPLPSDSRSGLHSGWPADEFVCADLLVLRRSRFGPSVRQSLLSSLRNDAMAPAREARATPLIAQPYHGNFDVLHSAVELDPEDIRSALFLGDAYFDRGDHEAARSWYVKAANLRDWWWTGFDTAIYVALLRVARLMEEAGEPAESVRDAFLRAWEICPDRHTPLYAIARRYRLEQRYQLGYLYAKPVADMPRPDPDTPLLVGEAPWWRARDELAHCAYKTGRKDEAFTLWRELLSHDDVADEDRERIEADRDRCIPTMLAAAFSYPEKVVRALLAAPGDPGVVVSMVAGPARISAEQTLNSFLNCCRDVTRVGRFLLVDAGLSPDDRAFLQDRYGFVEFIEPGSAESPGRSNPVDARLWLHLGRGWRFFAEDDLITRLAAVLAAEPDVFAVAVNPGGPTVSDPGGPTVSDLGGPTVSDPGGPTMFAVDRVNRAGGLGPQGLPDDDRMSVLAESAAAAGMRVASLDEVLCVAQKLVTVIGRGNSGTRAISRTLMRSGVFMGDPIKPDSADLVPAEDMYEACRIIGRHIPWLGGLNWDFGPVQTMPIPTEFTRLIERYLSSVLSSPDLRAGWKLPETTLCYPWISRLFPDIRYIFWVRNPRDCIANNHFTDDLRQFGVDYPVTDDPHLRRAISWKYQNDLVAAVPRPRHWISVRMEDFITRQNDELARLEGFLGSPLARVPVRTDSIDRHKQRPGVPLPDFLVPAMRAYGYEVADDEISHYPG